MNYLNGLFSLKEKIAIVTGSAQGNGKAIAEALLKADARVIMIDINENKLNYTKDEFIKNGYNNIETYICDLSDASYIIQLTNIIKLKYKHIDVLVNNAGISYSSELSLYDLDSWNKTISINVTSTFLLVRELYNIMNNGSIINITSLNAEVAFPNNPAYMASKGALKQLSKSLAYDLGKYNIRVNNIGPGYFHTAMTDKSFKDPVLNKQRKDKTLLNRWGDPNDLSGLIIFLSSDASSYITGQDIYIDGGWLIKGI